MLPKQLQNTEYSDSWIQVSLYSFQHYWINTQSGRLFNERSSKFPQGSFNKGYLRYSLSDGEFIKVFRAHQLVYYSFHNHTEVPKDLEIDHKDRNRSNNCILNLRLIPRRENLQNNGSSLPPGVSYDQRRRKYQSRIVYNRKQYSLGYFPLPCLAAKAYEKAEQQINEGTFIPPVRDRTSNYPGVSQKGTKWQAKYKNEYLGTHDTPELAHQAYLNRKGTQL